MKSPPIGGKVSLYDQLTKVETITGKTPSQLQTFRELTPPEELLYLHQYFIDFYNGDQFSYTELQSWEHFTGFRLEYWESELIRQLCLEKSTYDFERQQEYAKSQKGKK